jgi:hypothetical protein
MKWRVDSLSICPSSLLARFLENLISKQSIRSLFSGLFAAALAMVFSHAAAAQGISFVTSRDFPVGQIPSSVVVGDFNGDGKLDIVTGNQFSSTISVLLGKGDGTFQPVVTYAPGGSPNAVITGDFNGDGKLDILTVNGNSSVSVLLGIGDGTFRPPVITPFVSNSPTLLAVGDFNGDGKLDLVMPVSVPQLGNCAFTVMLGNGDGTFAPAGTPSAGPIPIPSVIQAADINRDGKLDLVASVGGNVAVFLGTGNGSFQQALNSAAGITGNFLAVADFNGDGKPDVVVGQSGAGLAVLLSNGNGTFGPPVVPTSLTVGGPVFASDINGDGKQDIFFVSLSGVDVLFGNGDGTFQMQPVQSFVPGPPLILGDFNGDGKPDVAGIGIGNPSTGNALDIVSVALGRGDGSFLSSPLISVNCQCRDAFADVDILIGDLNGDGIPDLVYMQTFPQFGTVLATLMGQGGGAYSAPVTFPGPGGTIANLAGGDFNNDGKLDFAISGAAIQVFLGNGDGTFQSTAQYGPQNSPFVAAADVNGDGKLDLVTADGTAKTVSVLLGNGDGTFGFATSFPVGNSANSLVVGDFNKDGQPDLAVATGSSVAVLLGTGNGTFGTAVEYNAGAGGTNVAAGDLNHDGNLDLVVSNSSSNYVSVLLGKGDGTFSPPVNITVGSTPTTIALSDFNLDGNQDIAVYNSDWGDIAVLLGNGDGTFQLPQYFRSGLSFSFKAGDLNGDGSPDIVTSGIALLFNRAAGPATVLAPSLVAFGNEGLAFPSLQRTVTVSNTGAAALNIGSIAISGAQSTDFSQTNTCGTTLTVGANCKISITFTPSALGLRTAIIQIVDNAYNTPQSIGLSGTGVAAAPAVSLSPGTLTFSTQAIGLTSTPQTIALSNPGSAPLNITSITTSGDFGATNNCGNAVAGRANCSINITFTPTAAGVRSGLLSIADNASGSPQTVALTGTGSTPSMSLGVATGSSSSATVLAGQPASYTLSIGGGGFSGTASLSCSGAPRGATCSVPSSVMVNATSALTFTVSVTTMSNTLTASRSNISLSPARLAIALFVFGILPGARRRRRGTLPWLLLAVVLLLCSCGGSGPQSNPNGTPVGTYTLTVTATSGSTSQSIPLTLTVQ